MPGGRAGNCIGRLAGNCIIVRKTGSHILWANRLAHVICYMSENEISFVVRGCVFKVYNTLGPGLLESAYEAALAFEMEKGGLTVVKQVPLPMVYETIRMDQGYRIDLVVNGKVIIEVKSVETLMDVHHKQLITYLRLSGLKLGLLINFNTDVIADSIIRKVNGL